MIVGRSTVKKVTQKTHTHKHIQTQLFGTGWLSRALRPPKNINTGYQLCGTSSVIGVRGFPAWAYFMLGRDGTRAWWLGRNLRRRRATLAWALARALPGPWPKPWPARGPGSGPGTHPARALARALSQALARARPWPRPGPGPGPGPDLGPTRVLAQARPGP